MQQENLENLETPELDKRLQAELCKETPDGYYVRRVLAVLKEREKNIRVEITPEMQAAMAKFTAKKSKRVEWHRPTAVGSWSRLAISVVTLVILLLMLVQIPVEAKAGAWWDKFVSWTEGLFSALDTGESDIRPTEYEFRTDNEGLQEVYKAVADLGVTVPVVPMWIPAEYELGKCRVLSFHAKDVVCADFSSGDYLIMYQAEVFERGVLREYQKDESNVAEHEINGIVFHVMENNKRWIAVWINENVECSLSAECEEEYFFEILNSI